MINSQSGYEEGVYEKVIAEMRQEYEVNLEFYYKEIQAIIVEM